jgi:hypothetical protein
MQAEVRKQEQTSSLPHKLSSPVPQAADRTSGPVCSCFFLYIHVAHLRLITSHLVASSMILRDESYTVVLTEQAS